MKTELLNDYIFGDLLRRYAIAQRNIRVSVMESQGMSEDEISAIPLISKDFDLAFGILQDTRAQALRLIAASISDSQE